MDFSDIILCKLGYSKAEINSFKEIPSAFLNHFLEKRIYKFSKIEVDIIDKQQLYILLTDYRIFCNLFRINKYLFEFFRSLIELGYDDEAIDLNHSYSFPFYSVVKQGVAFEDVKQDLINYTFNQFDKILYL